MIFGLMGKEVRKKKNAGQSRRRKNSTLCAPLPQKQANHPPQCSPAPHAMLQWLLVSVTWGEWGEKGEKKRVEASTPLRQGSTI